ncbi:hypothetical protein [Burkholderia sp. Bp9131]|uniref:hypothetical protein n=1 Tax=Burkholderia sp. Bp9131 TaxID=2184571 RepID=UPI000F5603C0|nr:hypothetical protein [Burkholderia sp. Bp9131]
MKDHSVTIATDGDDLSDDELLVLGIVAIMSKFREELERAAARASAVPGDDKRFFAVQPSTNLH